MSPSCSRLLHRVAPIYRISSNPRVGIINATSFPKLNPQGFNKGKPKQEYKPLTTLPFYKSNYKAPVRPADQLVKFKDNVDDEPENFQSLKHIGSLGGPVSEAPPLAGFAQVLGDGVEASNTKEAPKVGNPFDFPALPKKEEDAPEPEETKSEYEYYESDFESDEEPEATPAMNNLLRSKSQPAFFSSTSMVEEMKAAVPRFEVDLDDAIFRCCFPPVIEDPDFKIPFPQMYFSSEQATFEVHVSTVQSPHKFYFHYGDQELFMLCNRMENFYSQLSSDDLVMGVKSIRVGLVVAVKFDNTWHRAEVTKNPDEIGDVLLFLLDFGHKIRVPVSALRYLPLMFAFDPVKALRGAIIDIRPKYNADKWNSTVNEAFFDMVKNQKLKATIRRHRSADNEYDVQLCVCYNMIWFNIGFLLVQRGFAAVKEVAENCVFGLPLPVPV